MSVLGIFECAIWPCSLCCKCVAVPGDISIILSNSINSGAKTLASQAKYVFLCIVTYFRASYRARVIFLF